MSRQDSGVAEDRRCETCFWAEWTRTPNGRIKKRVAGRCRVKVEWPPVPYFLSHKINEISNLSYKESGFWWEGIWPDSGKDCPCWKVRV